MTRLNLVLLCMFCWLASGLIGCGGPPAAEVPDLAPVSGTVTLDGQPVAGVSVMFVPIPNPANPKERTKGSGAYGSTDASGKYSLRHRSGQPGVEPGYYAATFSKIAQPDGSAVPDGKTPEEVNASEQLPAHYTTLDPEKKPENVATVAKEGGTFDFALQSK